MRDKIALFAAPKFFFSSKNALPLSVKRFFFGENAVSVSATVVQSDTKNTFNYLAGLSKIVPQALAGDLKFVC
jgi:hypothetical protein